jgi:hypothetical protein
VQRVHYFFVLTGCVSLFTRTALRGARQFPLHFQLKGWLSFRYFEFLGLRVSFFRSIFTAFLAFMDIIS